MSSTRILFHPLGPQLLEARDTVDGEPICRHCGEPFLFISWQNFHHISKPAHVPSFYSAMRPRHYVTMGRSYWLLPTAKYQAATAAHTDALKDHMEGAHCSAPT